MQKFCAQQANCFLRTHVSLFHLFRITSSKTVADKPRKRLNLVLRYLSIYQRGKLSPDI